VESKTDHRGDGVLRGLGAEICPPHEERQEHRHIRALVSLQSPMESHLKLQEPNITIFELPHFRLRTRTIKKPTTFKTQRYIISFKKFILLT